MPAPTRPRRILFSALLLCALWALPAYAQAEGEEPEYIPPEEPYFTNSLYNLQAVTGGDAHFDVGQAIGQGELALQWYVNEGAGWQAVPGATGTQFALYTLTEGNNGHQVKCVVTNGTYTVESNVATLTVATRQAPQITLHPVGTTCVDGTQLTFQSAATGYPWLQLYWDVITPGGDVRLDVTRGNSFSMRFHAEDHGTQVRMRAVNDFGDEAISNAATIYVLPAQERTAPAIIRHPQDILITGDGTFSSSVQVSGHPEPDISWQYNYQGSGWYDVYPGGGWGEGQGTSFVLVSDWYERYDGLQFRCIARNIAGEVVSNPATAWAAITPFTDIPLTDEQVLPEEYGYFYTSCWGYPDVEVMWQESADEGASWQNMGQWQLQERYGAALPPLMVKATIANHNKLYRYIARNRFGEVISNTARLRVTISMEPVIYSQPQSQRVALGGSASFFLSASGWPKPLLQWQERVSSTAGWRDMPGQTGDMLTVSNLTLADSGRQFRCALFNGETTLYSDAAVLTVGQGKVETTTPTGAAGHTMQPVQGAGGAGGRAAAEKRSVMGIAPGPSGESPLASTAKMLKLASTNLHTTGTAYRPLRPLLPAAFVRSHFLPAAPLSKTASVGQDWLPWLGAGLTLLCVAECLWVWRRQQASLPYGLLPVGERKQEGQ